MADTPKRNFEDTPKIFKKRLKGLARFFARVAKTARLALTTQESRLAQMTSAIRKGDAEKLQTLIAEGAPIDGRGYGNAPPLAVALETKREDMLKILLDAGANPNVETDYAMSTVFIDAVRTGNAQGVAALLTAKIKPNLQRADSRKDAPLAIAVANGFETIAEMLMTAGANIDARNRYGRTALFHAAARGHDALAQKLLSAGARTDYRDEDGRDALAIAQAVGKHETHALMQRAIDARVPVWQEQGDAAIAHVLIARDAGYKLTEVFNFATERYVAITHNFETRRDDTVIRTFAELGDDSTLKEARARHGKRQQGATP